MQPTSEAAGRQSDPPRSALVLHYSTTVHRGGCKQFAVHGFGGWSVGLEAALTARRRLRNRQSTADSQALYDNDSEGKNVGLRSHPM